MRTILLFVFSFSCLFSNAQKEKLLPFRDETLPTEERVHDLISRLTLEEKVLQMLHDAPAIPRLGIAAYSWWNETLHGVARTSFPVTSFPQAIAMAATWNTASMRVMGDYAATEGRAIYNYSLQKNGETARYEGLTYWTPNINIFRDPRWGRGQETYGEDPYLTGMLGASFVRGLQGNDTKYLKAAACAKHFAVHSGPEASRHADNFNPSNYDLWDTYLPAFKKLVVDAKVAGVMCAYNAVNTQPCCANNLLLNDILRNQWGFKGYLTSDCWAIDDFFSFHKTHKGALEAAVDAVIHSTDLECGNAVYKTLINAVSSGLIKESVIDTSIKRLFTLRFQLGQFDHQAHVPFSKINLSALENKEHQAHALKMTQQSIVLLKNDRNILPLQKSIKKIAVIGPNADNQQVLLGNYNGAPSKVISLLEGIKNKLGQTTAVYYEKAIDYTTDTLFIEKNLTSFLAIDGQLGVKAEYFKNLHLSGNQDTVIYYKDFNQYRTEGMPINEKMGATYFSGRYTSIYTASKTESITIEANADEAFRVFIDNSLVANGWERNQRGRKFFMLNARAGVSYKISFEFVQTEGPLQVSLQFGHYKKTDFRQLAARLQNMDAIIFAGGISPQLEGEELPIAIPGFKSGDRTSISLPTVQTNLLKALKQTGKPIIFIMMTGSALAVPWEQENIPAILNAWYGGQSGGTAIADILFGDYNPSGRLPITFYKSDSDLPDFKDYSMKNRTYRYFIGKPLYPFGYGLSYTKFKYANMQVPKKAKIGAKVKLSVSITNMGNKDGEEVVQLYLSYPKSQSMQPQLALKGFQRIFLKRGATKTINFELTPEELSIVNQSGQLFQPKGVVTISVGGGQPLLGYNTTSNWVGKKIIVY